MGMYEFGIVAIPSGLVTLWIGAWAWSRYDRARERREESARHEPGQRWHDDGSSA